MIPLIPSRSSSSPLTTAGHSALGSRSTTTGRTYWRMLGVREAFSWCTPPSIDCVPWTVWRLDPDCVRARPGSGQPESGQALMSGLVNAHERLRDRREVERTTWNRREFQPVAVHAPGVLLDAARRRILVTRHSSPRAGLVTGSLF